LSTPDGMQRAEHFARKTDAGRWLSEMVTRVNDGTYVRPAAGAVTLREYAEQWRRSTTTAQGPLRCTNAFLRLHVYPVLGHRALASVRHSDARAFVTGLSTSLAPNTARQVDANTRTIFRSAVHDRLIVATPFANIKLPAIRWTRASALTVEQVRELAERAIPLLRALIVTAAGTGLRSDQDLHLHHRRASVRLGTHRRR